MGRYEDWLEERGAAAEAVEEVREQLNEVENSRDEIMQAKNEATERAQSAAMELELAHNEVAKLRQQLEQYRYKKDDIEANQRDARRNFNRLRSDVEQANWNLNSLTEKIDELEQENSLLKPKAISFRLDYSRARRTARPGEMLVGDIVDDDSFESRNARETIKANEAQIENYQQEIIKEENKLQQSKDRLQKVEHQLERNQQETQQSANQLAEAEQELQQQESRVNELEQEKQEIDQEVNNLENEFDEIDFEYESSQRELEEAEDELDRIEDEEPSVSNSSDLANENELSGNEFETNETPETNNESEFQEEPESYDESELSDVKPDVEEPAETENINGLFDEFDSIEESQMGESAETANQLEMSKLDGEVFEGSELDGADDVNKALDAGFDGAVEGQSPMEPSEPIVEMENNEEATQLSEDINDLFDEFDSIEESQMAGSTETANQPEMSKLDGEVFEGSELDGADDVNKALDAGFDGAVEGQSPMEPAEPIVEMGNNEEATQLGEDINDLFDEFDSIEESQMTGSTETANQPEMSNLDGEVFDEAEYDGAYDTNPQLKNEFAEPSVSNTGDGDALQPTGYNENVSDLFDELDVINDESVQGADMFSNEEPSQGSSINYCIGEVDASNEDMLGVRSDPRDLNEPSTSYVSAIAQTGLNAGIVVGEVVGDTVLKYQAQQVAGNAGRIIMSAGTGGIDGVLTEGVASAVSKGLGVATSAVTTFFSDMPDAGESPRDEMERIKQHKREEYKAEQRKQAIEEFNRTSISTP